jgi:hypothetical protein
MKSNEKSPIAYIEVNEQRRLNAARATGIPGRNGGLI